MIEIALTAQVLVALAVLAFFLASNQASIFHPAASYLAFHSLVFVIRPLLVYCFGFHSIWSYMVFQPTEVDQVRTLAVASAALIVFVGVSLRAGRCRTAFLKQEPFEFSLVERNALLWTTITLLPLILCSVYYTRGGPESTGERAANGVFIMTNSTGYLNDSQMLLGPLLCAWMVVSRFHWANLLPVGLYVGYRSWVGWSRWTILLFFLMVIIAFCWQRRLRWLPVWALVLAVPVVLLFNTLGHNRDLLRAYLEGKHPEVLTYARPGMSSAEKASLRWDTQDFANFDYLCAVIAIVPDRTGTYTYGLQYLQLFTEPIPRILWHGKPAGVPVRLFDLNHYANFLGLTVSLVGDGWMSGGWLGVLLTMAIAGIIVGAAHRTFWRSQENGIWALLYISFLGISPNWFRDGGISVFKFLLFTWAPLLVWMLFCWLLGGRLVPTVAMTLRPGDRLRLIQASPDSARE